MSENTSTNANILEMVARQALIEYGFLPDFPKEVVTETSQLHEAPLTNSQIKDLQHLPWISIDNDDSEDLDQITYAEDKASGISKIYVAVADVNSLVHKDSAIDQYAHHNTTSVYTATKVFPMLPLKLSTDLTSLKQDSERLAIIVVVNVSADGKFDLDEIFPAKVKNIAKLTYNKVADYLQNDVPLTLPNDISKVVHEQLSLQDRIAQRIKKYRYKQGALSFGTVECQPVIENGVVVRLEEVVRTRANILIENFMIAANVAYTTFMQNNNLPTLRRIVRTPKNWDRIVDLAKGLGYKLPSEPDSKALRAFMIKQRKLDPLHYPDLSLSLIKLIGKGEYVMGFPNAPAPGHFDLALSDYAHTTAPNRRYPDLVMQRILKAFFNKLAINYSDDELIAIASQCTEKEDGATKVERRVRKSAAAMVLVNDVGRRFDAIVTGASEKGTWVRLINPVIEGKLIRGYEGLDVGDKVTVQLLKVDVERGFIDFARVS